MGRVCPGGSSGPVKSAKRPSRSIVNDMSSATRLVANWKHALFPTDTSLGGFDSPTGRVVGLHTVVGDIDLRDLVLLLPPPFVVIETVALGLSGVFAAKHLQQAAILPDCLELGPASTAWVISPMLLLCMVMTVPPRVVPDFF